MGWIRLEKSITEHWLWQDPEKLRAWLDLLMLANYEDKKTPYKGKVITCERGTVNLSIKYLGERWGWGWRRTRDFLLLLQSDNMIELNSTTNRTTIKIVNYCKYQTFYKDNAELTAQRTAQRAQSEQHITNNIYNNNKDNIRPLRKNAFSDFEQNNYNFEELEKELLKK